MLAAFLSGFFLGLSLIIAIGAQNAFVLKQGILRQHIFFIALFCSIADSLLIILGVTGISYFLNDVISEYYKIIFGFSAFWLFSYGLLKLKSALKSSSALLIKISEPTSLLKSISIIASFTFLNPHVYLDTIILIGSVSQQFIEIKKIYYAIGACSASFVWFFLIAYFAKLISPIMQKPSHWRILDLSMSLIMFTLAYNIATQGGWF